MNQISAVRAEIAGSASHGIPFSEAVRVWARVAALSFGGPAGQISVMHRILVEERRWIGEQRFLQALNYCTLLPGPEAQQLATYIGWLMHKTKGGLLAGTLFVLPGLLAIKAVLRVGRRALKNNTMRALAVAAFIALFFYNVPFPVIIVLAALIGYVGGRANVPAFVTGGGHGKLGDKQVADS